MKITLEPRKTTWIPFINCKAKLEIEWSARIEYNKYSIHNNNTHTVDMRYLFSDLKGIQFIPSSQLIIKEQGIPLAITETVVSPVKDKFKSEKISDPFIEIHDRVASIEKSKITSRTLSKRLLERSWTETIKRSIRIENKTGKKIKLNLTITDKPAEELRFTSSNPTPTKDESPEYIFEIELTTDNIQIIKIELKFKNIEKIELPPESIKGQNQDDLDILQQTANQAMDFSESAEPPLSECIETEEEG